MSGIIPNGIVTLRVSQGQRVTLRFPVRVKMTAIAFAADSELINGGEGYALEGIKYRKAADYAETGDLVNIDVFGDSGNPFLGVTESFNLSSICTPAENGVWGDGVTRDIAQMDTDEWLEFSYYQPGVGGSDASKQATITVAYTGATNLD